MTTIEIQIDDPEEFVELYEKLASELGVETLGNELTYEDQIKVYNLFGRIHDALSEEGVVK